MVPQPHFVRPFEDPFVKPVKKPSPPNCTIVPPPQTLYPTPPPPSLVNQQLPPPQAPVYHPTPPPITVTHHSPSASQPVSTNHNSYPRPLDVTNLVAVSVSNLVTTASVTSISTSTSIPVIAVTERSDSPRIMSCNRLTNKVKSRLDSVAASDFEDLSPSLVLTKGPPDKLDASPRKLRFLSTFGLTTLTTRNELELNKLSRCKSLPNVVVEEEGAAEGPPPKHPPPPFSLPHPRQSPRSLPHSNTKLTYMATLQLCPLSHDQRKEREVIWQEVLAERRRRKAVTPLVQYCSEARVNSPDYCSVRWPGIEGVLHAYHQYHTERSLEASVLREECSRLQTQLATRQGEACALQQRLDELRTTHDELVCEGHNTQRSLDTLMAAVRALMALGHSND